MGESLDGIITSWNHGAEKMFGYTSEDVIGQSISILHSPGDSEELVAILELIRQGIATGHFETKRQRKDGTRIDVSISVSPIYDENRQVIGAAKIIRDITDKKRVEALAQRTEKLEIANRLAASVAHEINNPLSALTNLLYLLRGEGLATQASEYLSMAERELTRVTHITTQALGFYQESGAPAEHRLSEILDQAIAFYHHRIENSGIILEKRYEDYGRMICRGGEVKQVFVNLIGNAIDAMRGTGRLQIRLRSISSPDTKRAGVQVSIVDSGCGISREGFNHIFEPFYTTKGQTRVGLGLWMCQQIVARHRGTIRIKSGHKSQDPRTIVIVFFPSLTGSPLGTDSI
jgi:PAS domain S-box-containing protein